ncbi:phage tail protein [Providencia stuartii]|uniref:phage tail protein n=1 Tax=Providencia stuartii TaxID=588 RepID=UPI000DFD6E9D|nr:phage tail protein [Providencia stuartii]MDN0004838.1 phage tail protein [Providencia stuartii]SUC41812.1 Phage Tail Collar Domain [Providencia stuartii]
MSEFVEFYSTGNTKIDRNGNLKASGSSDALTDFPVGAPIPWPQSTAPAGYLVCNGQTFNKNTYPLLAQAYPSGILPDLRGEFIRGLDAGRNIDNGRAVLSAQSDAIRNITGSIETAKSNTNGEGAFSSSTNGTTGAASDSTGSVKLYAKAVFKASDSVPTANENRPRNIAFLYIVRAA